jgi:hypothetical protein
MTVANSIEIADPYTTYGRKLLAIALQPCQLGRRGLGLVFAQQRSEACLLKVLIIGKAL